MNPSNAPLVVGQLLDDECPEDFIKGLILSVRSLLPVEPLVEECEKRWDANPNLCPFFVFFGVEISLCPLVMFYPCCILIFFAFLLPSLGIDFVYSLSSWSIL